MFRLSFLSTQELVSITAQYATVLEWFVPHTCNPVQMYRFVRKKINKFGAFVKRNFTEGIQFILW